MAWANYHAARHDCNNSGCVHSHTCPSYHRQHSALPLPVNNFPAVSHTNRGDLAGPPCIFFQQNRCTQGDQCRFSHIASDINIKPTVPCKFFRQGSCRNGEDCTFLHETAPVGSPALSPTPTAELSPHLIPLPPSPHVFSVSVEASAFEPCTYEETGDSCVVQHIDPTASFDSPTPDLEGVNDWIQFSGDDTVHAAAASPPVCRFLFDGVCDLEENCGCKQGSINSFQPSKILTLILCRFFPGCAKGDLCPFVHDVRAQKPPLPPDASIPPLCRFQADCRKGNKCRFRHDLSGSWGTEFEARQTDTNVEENLTWGSGEQTSAREAPPPVTKVERKDDTCTSSSWFQDVEDWGASAAPQWSEQVPPLRPDDQVASGWAGEETPIASSSESRNHDTWAQDTHDTIVEDAAVEDSWNRPWPEAAPLDVKPAKKGNCLYWGQGYCARGDDCQFRHVREPEAGPDESKVSQETPEPGGPVPMAEEPAILQRSVHNCKVYFGAGIIPEKVITAFDSQSVILSNYPAGIAHDVLLQIAEPYGVVNNTTFRLSAGGVEAHIEFEEYMQAAQARAALNGMVLDGQAIRARLGTAGSVSGIAHEPGGQVKLMWDTSSLSGWAFYANVRQAKDESARLNGMIFGGRTIIAEYRKPTQSNVCPVRLAGLPPRVNRDDLHAFCVGSSSVSLNKPNYLESQDDKVLARLRECGTVTSFEVLPTDPSHSKITAFAEFSTGEGAATAVQTLNKKSFDFLGKGTISVQPHFHSKYTCTKDVFNVIRTHLDRLRESSSGCTIQYYEQPPCVHVYGRHPDVIVRDLVLGTDLPYWDPYFETRPAEDALAHINNNTSFHVRCDRWRQGLRIWGDKQAGEKQISRLLNRVRAKRHSLPVSVGQLSALLNGGLQSLQDEFGETKILVDLHSRRVLALGDIQTKVENHLEALASDSRGTGNCCLCFSDADESFRLPCTHIYCSSCLKHILRPVPGIEFTPPKCVAEEPSSDSLCLAPIPLSVILSQLPERDRTRLYELSLVAFIRSQDDHRFCISGCAVIYRTSSPGTIITCPECRLHICASCNVLAHPGLVCKEYQALLGEVDKVDSDGLLPSRNM